jgi:RND family efflux transporter MFP subunit
MLRGLLFASGSRLSLATLAPCIALEAIAAGPPVTVAEAETATIVEIVRVSGTITSPQSAVLSPSVAGLIETVHVDAGDRVESDQVIVTLDRELEELALQRANAEAAQAQADLDDARRRLSEAERVGPTKAIAESEIKSLRAEVARGEASLQAATAAARQQQAIVRRHSVRAPFAGVVSQRLAQVGEWVNPGDGLVELVATDRLRFDFRVPQTRYAQLDRDTPVEIVVDAVPNQAFAGRIQAIVPVKDPGARTFLLRVVAASDDAPQVTPGMSAQASLRIDSGHSGVVVPRDALLRYPDGRRTVWVVEQEDGEPVVHERRVETGVEFEGLIEIRSGLTAGASIVTRGNEILRDGQAVSLQ